MIKSKCSPILFFSFFTVAVFCLFFNCKKQESYSHYSCGPQPIMQQLTTLFNSLKKQESHESRFIINIEISRILNELKENQLLNAFLLDYINKNPQDPFNGYYLNLIATYFKNRKMYQMSEIYYKRILRNHPSITTKDQPIQIEALESLARFASDPKDKITYATELVQNYSSSIDLAPIYQILAQSYEDIGMYNMAVKAWKDFINSPYAGMQGEENIRANAKSFVQYYEYPNKNWCYSRLDTLLDTIQYAIVNRNNANIRANMSKVNFFTLSWAQDADEANRDFISSLGSYMRRQISFAPRTKISPSAKEFYWETNNWSYHISTWFLYFRRIDFPADPAVHGKWEWAGIYFGKKPFDATTD